MNITRTSTLTGITRTRDIDITEAQLQEWQDGALIQNVVPHLSPEDREFLVTGVTTEEWDNAFTDPDNTGPIFDDIEEMLDDIECDDIGC